LTDDVTAIGPIAVAVVIGIRIMTERGGGDCAGRADSSAH
jgi:hypothetical protein